MLNYRILTLENFETLMLWLSPNRDEAGELYEEIRSKLIRFFLFKGCSNAEDLADETINRVVGKLTTLDLSTGNKPITICYGFANNVWLEYLKAEKREVGLEEARGVETGSERHSNEKLDALERCLDNLNESDRNLVLQYYDTEKNRKSEFRRNLAEGQNLKIGTFQVKLFRLRKSLQNCIEKSLKK